MGERERVVELVGHELMGVRALARERDPYAVARNDADKTWTIREVVRINHLKNCLLCHPPMDREAALEARKTASVPVGSVAAKGVPTSGPYGSGVDAFVRADTTYLRQDFSTSLDVKPRDAAAIGWPASQRFDFVVRTLADRVPAPETLRRLIRAILDHQHEHLQDDASAVLIGWPGR